MFPRYHILISSVIGVSICISSAIYIGSLSAGSEFLSAATTLSDASIISSQDEYGYRLGDTITRAELAKVAANLGGYIESLERAGVVRSGNTFRPQDSITRAEMVKMLLGVIGEA
jgi:S-layer homology domain